MNASNEDKIVPTSEELLARTSSWTLACDNLLLNKLKRFSQDLENTSSSLNEDCQNLSRDATVLQAKLHNVTNQFLALSSSQFVENRVQDFEEAAASVASRSNNVETTSSIKKKTKSEREAELIVKMKKSIQIGISANSQHVQSLNQELEQPKPSAFPHLIGSSKFFSSRYVGLVQDERRAVPATITNYQKNSDEKTLAFQSSNHSLAETITSLETSTSKSKDIPVTTNPTPPSEQEQSFPSSAASPVISEVKNISHSSVHQPLLKNHHQTNQSVIIPPTHSNEVPPTNARKPIDDYFNDDGPPPVLDSDEDSDDDFKPIVGPGGGGRIFADDDDDDIFNDSQLFPPTKVQNSFFNMPNSTENIITPAIRASPPPHPDEAKNLHNNDIFTSATTKTKEPMPAKQSKVGTTPIIVQDKISATNSAKSSVYHHPTNDKTQQKDDIQEEGKGDVAASRSSTSGSKKSKIPPGGVSVFGNVPPTEIIRTQQKNTKEQIPKSVAEEVVVKDKPETQLPNSSSSANAKCVNVSDRGSSVDTNAEDQKTTSHSSLKTREGPLINDPIIIPVSRQQPKSIFNDDDSDDDLFSTRKPKQPQPSASSTHQISNKTIFNNKDSLLTVDHPPSSSVVNRQPSSKLATKIKRSIFDDSDSDDGLFSSSSSTTSSKITQQKTKQPVVFPTHEENKSRQSHSASTKAVEKNRGGGSSLFDKDSDDESDSDLFSSNSSKGINLNKPNTTRTNTTIIHTASVITTSQSHPSNLINEPEAHDKSNLFKATTTTAEGSTTSSKRIDEIPGRSSVVSGTNKMQSELVVDEEKKETEIPSSAASTDLDQSKLTNSFHEKLSVVDQSADNSIMSPPAAPEPAEDVGTSSSANTADPIHSPTVDSQNSGDENPAEGSFDDLDKMEPPVDKTSVALIGEVDDSKNVDTPENEVVSVQKSLAAVQGSKISQLKERLPSSSEKSQKEMFNEDSDDDLFSTKSPKAIPQPATSTDARTKTKELDHPTNEQSPQKDGTQEEGKGDVAASTSGAKKSKIPPGGVSVFGKVPPKEISTLRKQQNTKVTKEQISKSVAAVDKPETQLPNSSSSSAKFVNVSDQGTNEEYKKTTSHSSLTSSEGSLNDPVIVPVSRQQPKSIFNDDDSDDDLFSSRKPKPPPPSASSTHQSTNKTIFNNNDDLLLVDQHPPTTGSSFNRQPSSKLKTKIKGSIFDDSDSDGDLFSSSRSKTSSKITQQKTQQPLVLPNNENSELTPTKESLDDVDRMKPPAPDKTSDTLMGDSKNVDTPDNKSVVSVQKIMTAVHGSKISQLKERLSSSSEKSPKEMFNEDSDDDLFSTKKPIRKITSKDNTPPTVVKPSTIIKSEVDVKKLALNLKINPLAMMPGAKPIKQKSLESPISPTPTPKDIVKLEDSPTSSATSPTSEVHVQNIGEAESPSKSTPETPIIPSSLTDENEEEESTETSIPKPLLPNLAKGRAKIQFKRKPPSKKLLHSCNNSDVIDSTPDVDKNDELENKVVNNKPLVEEEQQQELSHHQKSDSAGENQEDEEKSKLHPLERINSESSPSSHTDRTVDSSPETQQAEVDGKNSEQKDTPS